MSAAISDSAGSANVMRQTKVDAAEESFAALVKPFDSVEDDGDLPASRAYPKVFDVTSPAGSPTNKDAEAGPIGRNDKNSHGRWPKPDKQQTGSKRKRETNKRHLPELVGHQQDDGPLQRWLHESSTEGSYHGIADTEEDPCQACSTQGHNTKQHRS